MWSMITLEVMALLAGFVCTTLTIFVVAKVRNEAKNVLNKRWVEFQRSAIHPNFARIVLVFTSHFYVLAASRIVLLIFQIGVFDVHGEYVFCQLKETSFLRSIIVADSCCVINRALSRAGECHYAFRRICKFFPCYRFLGSTIQVIERTFATIYIDDYEVCVRYDCVSIVHYRRENVVSFLRWSFRSLFRAVSRMHTQ